MYAFTNAKMCSFLRFVFDLYQNQKNEVAIILYFIRKNKNEINF